MKADWSQRERRNFAFKDLSTAKRSLEYSFLEGRKKEIRNSSQITLQSLHHEIIYLVDVMDSWKYQITYFTVVLNKDYSFIASIKGFFVLVCCTNSLTFIISSREKWNIPAAVINFINGTRNWHYLSHPPRYFQPIKNNLCI